MQALTTLLALSAPIVASKKHEGKEHSHVRHRRQVPGLGSLAATPPNTAAATPSSSITPTISSYVFPTTFIQQPVITLCPNTSTSSAMPSMIPVPSMLSMADANITASSISTSTKWIPIHVNATALLPNGSTTVFLSASSTTVLSTITSSSSGATVGADTARIIFGNDGCQTVFSPVTTTWCSTTVKPAGMLPVAITDCDQWVTFSSERLDACSTKSMPAASSIDGPIAYYLAHWYDLVQSTIPDHVQVLDCLPRSSGLDCATLSESWEVVTSTTTSVGTSSVSFAGPAVVTVGTITLMTMLSFESTTTMTQIITSSGIERHRLADASTASQPTVTVLVTMPTTKTLSLDSLTRETVTIHTTSTLQVTETRTRSIADASPAGATELS